MSWVQSQFQRKDGFLNHPPSISPLLSPSIASPPHNNNNFQKELSPPSSSSNNKLSPAVIFIIVIIAAIFFISSLLHLFVKFLTKQYSSPSISQSNRYTEFNSGSDVLQRQLQQLFHLHDSGLDQTVIDSLPVFLYKEIMGLKEAFDCAVCLCEFSEQDQLRLLPLCSHAFHIDCIDKWLLSNSTCPLCRGTLFTPGIPIENPIFVLDDSREGNELQEVGDDGFSSSGQKPEEIEGTISEARVFPVRLGKFRTVNNGGEREEAETSSNNMDARRCYSMGSLQYVVGDTNLQVALNNDRDGNTDMNVVKVMGGGQNRYSLFNRDMEGKKLSNKSKGESFSVSKIWLWSKKDKLSTSSQNFVP